MTQVSLTGRALMLTTEPEPLRRQLAGENMAVPPLAELLDDISTDEMAPAWASYHYDAKLARYCLCGLRGGSVREAEIMDGGFEILVAGFRFGCGSSRETAPYAQRAAGIRLVFARSFEKIYRQNAQNLGLLTSSDFSLLERLLGGESLPLEEFCGDLDPLSAEVLRHGGLFGYNRARLAGTVSLPLAKVGPRPMTLAEKIIARHVARDPVASGAVAPVAPGQAVFVRADVRFSHDYVTAMADALLRAGFGEQARVSDPDSVYLFRDHLTFASRVLGERERRLGLIDQTEQLAREQESFAARHGIRLFGEVERDGAAAGSEAICHNKVIEALALPGSVVVGTDSHTCMAGVLGCLAFGVGSTDMANAFVTRDVRLKVPETVRVELLGQLRADCCAKDVMLELCGREFIRGGGAAGKVLEFCGEGLLGLGLDERATLTNMSVEASAFTGIIEPDEVLLAALGELRGLTPAELEPLVVRADRGAEYAAELSIDLGRIRPMVALPGDPKNSQPVASLGTAERERVRIDIAYGGSCTGGKRADMDMYASVLERAVERGQRVAPGVELYIQFGSQLIRRYAEERGYIAIFERVGAILLDPACGACIRAGPGVSTTAEQVTVSAINRNFPGRSGPGRVYLASPLTVAASALSGYITSFDRP
ncbi:MAG TPA: aconitase family protein [Polyangiaceae bacterium]|jgi:3-isopropylmalate/(R)-2-methylmalate dehydratase large subunit|nr:aconitase family protein [Polyangiaceae bacterium]